MDRAPALSPVGEWLGASFRRVGGRWATLTALLVLGILSVMLALAVVYGLAFGIVFAVQGRDLMERIATHPEFLDYVLEDESLGSLVALLHVVAMVVAIRVWLPSCLGMFNAACDDSLGWRAALARSKGRAWPFLGLLVVQQVLVNLATLLLIVPGIWLALRLWFAPVLFAREGARPIDSIRRAYAMTSGRAWGLFGRALLLGLVTALIGIVPIVGWVVSFTLSLVGWAELYRQLGGGRTATAT